jgi:large subunit ribosomal protein L34
MWISYVNAKKGERTEKELNLEAHFGILTVMEKFITLKKVRRKRKHGFLSRMETHPGQKVLKARRAKSRKRLAI